MSHSACEAVDSEFTATQPNSHCFTGKIGFSAQ